MTWSQKDSVDHFLNSEKITFQFVDEQGKGYRTSILSNEPIRRSVDLRPIQKALRNLWKGVRTFDDDSLVSEIAVFESFKEFLINRIGSVCTDSVIERLSTELDYLRACQIAGLALQDAMNSRVDLITDNELEFAIDIMVKNESLMNDI